MAIVVPPRETITLDLKYDFDVNRIEEWTLEASPDLFHWQVTTNWNWENNDPMTDTVEVHLDRTRDMQFFRVHVLKVSN